MEGYDSRQDTKQHIGTVRQLLSLFSEKLKDRGQWHDHSKLQDPELSVFNEYTPKLAGTTYGSEEYKKYLVEMQIALGHHYKHNRHHPEHFIDVAGMNLIDIIEMFCDWKAATMRHNDGDMKKSIEINQARFDLSPQLTNIFLTT